MNNDPVPTSRARRLAAAATLLVPVTLAAVVFVLMCLGQSSSGAGLSAGNRPVMAILMSAFGAFGWFIATSALYALHRPARELPRTARAYGLHMIWGAGAGALDSRPARTTARIRDLLGLAIVKLPLFMFLPPLLLGLLFQPDVWHADEAVAVGVMGAFVLGWSLFLTARAAASR
jgi:hypothetical protein